MKSIAAGPLSFRGLSGILPEVFRKVPAALGVWPNLGARQRSGEGVVRRNGRPKGSFWRVRFLSTPSCSRFLATFSPFSPPRKVPFPVERRGHHRAWRGAVLGWTSPQISGRKFLPEICVQKGQLRFSCVLRASLKVKTFISCYRTPGPRKGFRRVSEGVSEGSLKGFRRG